MRLPKAKVYLKDWSKVTTLFDIGAEINVMTRKLIKDTNLAMRRRLKLELVLHISHNHPFLGFCEDVKVVIKKLKTKHLIFVIETGDHDFVLGQLFLNSMKFNQKYKPDKIYSTITHPHTYQTAVFYTLAP